MLILQDSSLGVPLLFHMLQSILVTAIKNKTKTSLIH
jgi:hypothetical protein